MTTVDVTDEELKMLIIRRANVLANQLMEKANKGEDMNDVKAAVGELVDMATTSTASIPVKG